jgi:hypothetical protein
MSAALTDLTLALEDFESLVELSLAVDYQLDQLGQYQHPNEAEALSFYKLHRLKLALDLMCLNERIARQGALKQ